MTKMSNNFGDVWEFIVLGQSLTLEGYFGKRSADITQVASS
ncbi:MAG: hypothetical protein PUP91_21620 [Rhizonema sp. PD37]|nr:hypothetical protein [Rhizonema sp. PD37]